MNCELGVKLWKKKIKLLIQEQVRIGKRTSELGGKHLNWDVHNDGKMLIPVSANHFRHTELHRELNFSVHFAGFIYR